MQLFPIKTGLLQANFDLIAELELSLKKNEITLKEKDILVITSKIVALSQGRMVDLSKITPSKKARIFKATRYGHGKENPRIVELVMRESDLMIKGNSILALKDGVLIPEAGIDLSNAPQGFAILWPADPWETAQTLIQKIKKKFGLKKLGLIISDSTCRPLRLGVTGVAISFAGFEGVEDARGQKDVYGRKLEVTRKAVADNLASAALVLMGEAGEKIPCVVIRDVPVKFTERVYKIDDVFIPASECIFEGMYDKKIKKFLTLKNKVK